jgi:hypothetical protein
MDNTKDILDAVQQTLPVHRGPFRTPGSIMSVSSHVHHRATQFIYKKKDILIAVLHIQLEYIQG